MKAKIALGVDRRHETESNTSEKENINSSLVKDKISVAEYYLTICLYHCEPVLNLLVRWFLLLQGLLTETMISVGQARLCFPPQV